MKIGHYKTLDIEHTASQEEIKKAFHKLAHIHHPDKKTGNEATFKLINEAYQVLGDPQKRMNYDYTQKFGNNPGPTFRGFGYNPTTEFYAKQREPFQKVNIKYNSKTGKVEVETIKTDIGSQFEALVRKQQEQEEKLRKARDIFRRGNFNGNI